MRVSDGRPPQSVNGPTADRRLNGLPAEHTHTHTHVSPVSVAIHEEELESDEAVEVRVIVPGRFIQEEDVPVCGDEHEAGETVETAQHDAHSPLNQNTPFQLRGLILLRVVLQYLQYLFKCNTFVFLDIFITFLYDHIGFRLLAKQHTDWLFLFIAALSCHLIVSTSCFLVTTDSSITTACRLRFVEPRG